MTVIGPLPPAFLSPTSPLLSFGGFAGIDITSERARPTRPISFGNGLRYAAPAAAVRIRTNSPTVTFHLSRNGLYTDVVLVNDIFSVFVDGVLHGDYNLTGGTVAIDLEFEAAQCRTIELLYCHGDGYDFLGITYNPVYPVFPFLDRPKMVVAGDSITQGAFASSARNTWAYRLGAARNVELINMGYSGGVVATLGDGSWAEPLAPDDIVLLIGHNDFQAQTAVSTFKASCKSLLQNWLASTTAAIYAATATWTNVSKTIPISSYRTAISEAVSEINNERLTLVDGLALATNSTAHFPDGVHPNDAGSAAIALNLSALM